MRVSFRQGRARCVEHFEPANKTESIETPSPDQLVSVSSTRDFWENYGLASCWNRVVQGRKYWRWRTWSIYAGKPRVLRTSRRAMALNSSLCSRHIIAASTLAPLSSLGSVGKNERHQFELKEWTSEVNYRHDQPYNLVNKWTWK